MAHTYNPSYSGGTDQEDLSLRPVWSNSLRDPIWKIPSTKRSGGVVQVIEQVQDPEFNPSAAKGGGGGDKGDSECLGFV
jgi:hypothetical protein